MSEKLLESDGLMTNLRDLFSKAPEAAPEGTRTDIETTPDEPTTSKVIPEKYNWGWWKAELKRRLEENKKAAPDVRKSDEVIEQEFFKDFFETNWIPDSASKLLDLGAPLRTVIKVLGFGPEKNPLLAFVRQGWVQKYLLQPGLLNANTFRAIYNALATRQVAGSEFLKDNDYNIIYCRDLYSKSASTMAEYLELQKNILNPNAKTGNYAAATLKNRKVFFQINIGSKDLNPSRNATKLSSIAEDKVPKAKDPATKLNSLEFVKEASGKNLDPTTSLSGDKQDILVKQLQTPAVKYAAILALALTTDSTQAKEALKKDIFGTVSSDDIRNATVSLASRDIMPKGKLNKTDADALVAKIVSSLT
jgi:hypothetical protein